MEPKFMPIPSTGLSRPELHGQRSPTIAKAADASVPRLLLTRTEALATLRIGETTLHWLQRTRKLKPINIGARVLFNRAEVERLAKHGCTLTEAEKQAAAKRKQKATEAEARP
jgi:hypothetical protein